MLVIVGNIITQNNTNKTVETISEELDVFKNEISNKKQKNMVFNLGIDILIQLKEKDTISLN